MAQFDGFDVCRLRTHLSTAFSSTCTKLVTYRAIGMMALAWWYGGSVIVSSAEMAIAIGWACHDALHSSLAQHCWSREDLKAERMLWSNWICLQSIHVGLKAQGVGPFLMGMVCEQAACWFQSCVRSVTYLIPSEKDIKDSFYFVTVRSYELKDMHSRIVSVSLWCVKLSFSVISKRSDDRQLV